MRQRDLCREWPQKAQKHEPFAKFARKRDLLSGRVVVPGKPMASQVQIPFEGVILQEHSAPISCPTPNFAKGSHKKSGTMRNDQGVRALCDQIRQTASTCMDIFATGISRRVTKNSFCDFCAFCGEPAFLTRSHPILKKAEHHVCRQNDLPRCECCKKLTMHSATW